MMGLVTMRLYSASATLDDARSACSGKRFCWDALCCGLWVSSYCKVEEVLSAIIFHQCMLAWESETVFSGSNDPSDALHYITSCTNVLAQLKAFGYSVATTELPQHVSLDSMTGSKASAYVQALHTTLAYVQLPNDVPPSCMLLRAHQLRLVHTKQQRLPL